VLSDKLKIEIEQVDEFLSLEKGLEFIDTYAKSSTFQFSQKLGKIRSPAFKANSYPFMLTNIGSGTSILKFDSPNSFSRVSGTSWGGGTYLGLCNLILGTNNFEELLQLSEQGDNSNLDLVIEDLYG
jgi:pantothenate kinase